VAVLSGSASRSSSRNRGGAGGTSGPGRRQLASRWLHDAADTDRGATINATLYDSLPYNFLRDIAPVSGLVHSPKRHGGQSRFAGTLVAEFIAYTKANPGKVKHGLARHRHVRSHGR